LNAAPLPVTALALGCSAGGFDALCALLPRLEADCDIPVFVVVHLPRERPSHLVDIFARRCVLRVVEAEDKQPVEPGTIYFAPPDYHLLLERGPTLALSVDEVVHFSRPAIDVLFESAADVYGAGLWAVVLSGANEDGASGLLAVERAGGTTLVQDPEAAAAPAMPRAALRQVPRSPALALAEMAELLNHIRGGLCARGAFPPRTFA
jgi:two-component system, chemotaxis family, protein-glutamate methylesterase/glutaminase